MEPARLAFQLAAHPGVDDVREHELVRPQWDDPIELRKQLWRSPLGDPNQDAHHRNVAATVSVAASSSTGVMIAPSFRYWSDETSTPCRRTMTSQSMVESEPTGVRFGPRSAPTSTPTRNGGGCVV